MHNYCYAQVVNTDTGATCGVNEQGELCFKGECIMKGYLGSMSIIPKYNVKWKCLSSENQ